MAEPIQRQKERAANEAGESSSGSYSPTQRGAIALSLTVLLIGACASGDVATVVQLVSEKNADPFSRDESGRTPLGAACEAGHLEVVRHLIEKEGVSPGLRGAEGRTPLHDAARGCHVQVVRYLIENGVNPDVRDDNGLTPLDCSSNDSIKYYISKYSHVPVIHSHDFSPSISPENDDIDKLVTACEEGDIDKVKYLVEDEWVSPNNPDNDGDYPLHRADNLDIVMYLVEEQNCDISCRDKRSSTALHDAASRGKLDIVKYLIDVRGCDPMCENNYGSTPLHFACYGGSLEVVKYLIEEKKANILCQDKNGCNPLHSAATRGSLEVVQYLTEEHDLMSKDESGNTPLHVTALSGQLDMFKYLVDERGYDSRSEGQGGCTPLHSACIGGETGIVKYLIEEKKVDLLCQDEGGFTPLHMAAYYGSLEVVRYLIEEQNSDAMSRTRFWDTPLHQAALGGKLDIVQYLIDERGCDPMCKSEDGCTPLHRACREGSLEVIKYLIEEKKVDFLCQDENGYTPLHMAAYYGSLEAVRYLIEEQNCDVMSRDKFGDTPLHAAAVKDKLDVVQFLINERGCDPMCGSADGSTPLHKACEGGNIVVVKYLIEEKEVDLLCQDENGSTPLHIAAQYGSLEAVRYLIEEQNCDVMSRDRFGNTPLHRAALGGELDVVQYLIDERVCDPMATTQSYTPLHLACQEGSIEIIKYLIEDKKVDTSSQTQDGKYPLHIAAENGHLPLVQLLVGKYHCDPNVIDYGGRTPAELARSEGHSDILSYFRTTQDSSNSPVPESPVQMSTEEAEEVVKKLLKEEGKFKQKNMVVVLTGLMGAGKTTLLHRMFGKPLPDQYSSTSIAERSWQGISHHAFDIKEFILIDLMKQFEMVARMIHQKLLEEKKREKVRTAERVPPREIKPDDSKKRKTISNPTTLKAGPVESLRDKKGNVGEMETVEGTSKEKVVKEVIVKKIPESMKELVELLRKNPRDYGEMELVHMIDTGGQPECLEILPSLIHNADLTLLVVNVSILLDECIVPSLHTHGQKHEKRNLPTTNRQIIEQVAHTMAGKSNSKIMVIATHTDCIEETKRQRAIFELKCLIKNILPAEALLARSKSSPIFEVNLRDPETTIVSSICKNIRSRCKTMPPVEVPPSFVLFEREAMIYINEQEGRKVKVLSFSECLEIGKKLDMTENIVEAALTYLHNNNILLFFKEIGSGIVFLEPKIVIDFVNDIIRFSYSVECEDIQPSLTVAQTEALSQGMITKELLAHEMLTKNFVSGLFEASHAIEIFKEIYIIAKSTQKMEHIMMCLLPRLTEEKKNKLVPATEIEPLIIYFEDSVSPSGSFGNTIACLISKFKWKICTKENEEPECLYHDIAKLHPNSRGLKITLLNKTKYFEVTAEVSIEDNHRCSKLPKIKENVYDAVKEVLKTMRMKVNVLLGFKCMCKFDNKIKFHILQLPEEDEEHMECQYGALIQLDQKHLVWKKDKALECLCMEDLHNIRSVLVPITYRWKHIGLALRLDHGQLKKIEAQYRDLDDCLTEMLSLWLKKNYNTERFGPPTWKQLADAVRDPAGGNDGALAESLVKNHLPRGTQSQSQVLMIVSDGEKASSSRDQAYGGERRRKTATLEKGPASSGNKEPLMDFDHEQSLQLRKGKHKRDDSTPKSFKVKKQRISGKIRPHHFENQELKSIRGADITAEITVNIDTDQQVFYWKNHGFHINIPAGAISNEEQITLRIQASVSGEYQFPDDGALVSGVYWLSLHPPVEKFNKSVTITLQHCASDDDPKLTFVTAHCTQETLPYTFKPVSSFSLFNSGAATIQMDHFSAIAVIASSAESYAFCYYNIPRQPNVYDAHITVTKNLELHLRDVEKKYGDWEAGPCSTTFIKEDSVSLFIPDFNGVPENTWGRDGWKLTPLVTPLALKRRILESHEKGKLIPRFQLELLLEDQQNPRTLNQCVSFTGVDPAVALNLRKHPPSGCPIVFRHYPLFSMAFTKYPAKFQHRRTKTISQSRAENESRVAAEQGGEITKLCENLSLIIRAVTIGGSPQHFATKLVEKGFIPQDTCQQILNTLGLAPDGQASKLMDSVFAKMELSERKKEMFENFVDIFAHEKAYKDLAHKLKGTQPQQRGPIIVSDGEKPSTSKALATAQERESSRETASQQKQRKRSDSSEDEESSSSTKQMRL